MMNSPNNTVVLPWPSDDAHTPEAVYAEVDLWLGDALALDLIVWVYHDRAPDTGYPLVQFTGAAHLIAQVTGQHSERFGDESITYPPGLTWSPQPGRIIS